MLRNVKLAIITVILTKVSFGNVTFFRVTEKSQK
jgi:hypothetical protein